MSVMFESYHETWEVIPAGEDVIDKFMRLLQAISEENVTNLERLDVTPILKPQGTSDQGYRFG